MKRLKLALIAGMILSVGTAFAKPHILLVPGAGTSGPYFYFKGLNKLLKVTGHQDYFDYFKQQFKREGYQSSVCPKTGLQDRRSVEERVEACVQDVKTDQLCADGKQVIIVGHSMGGVIARGLAVEPSLEGCVDSVVSISTPHRGTVLANFVLERRIFSLTDRIIHKTLRLLGVNAKNKRYLPQMRTRADDKLDSSIDYAQNPEVDYFSITNSLNRSRFLPLEFTRRIIGYEMRRRGWGDDQNDGIVPESSMLFGEHLGRVEANHAETTCLGVFRFSDGCRDTFDLLRDAVRSRHP